MRRCAAILLIGLFLALGSGAVQYAHNHAHLAADEAHAVATAAAPAGSTHHHPTHSDETDCFLHALMHAPMLSTGWMPALICLGLFVAFLTMLASQPATHKAVTRLDCRGPPAHLLISA